MSSSTARAIGRFRRCRIAFAWVATCLSLRSPFAVSAVYSERTPCGPMMEHCSAWPSSLDVRCCRPSLNRRVAFLTARSTCSTALRRARRVTWASPSRSRSSARFSSSLAHSPSVCEIRASQRSPTGQCTRCAGYPRSTASTRRVCALLVAGRPARRWASALAPTPFTRRCSSAGCWAGGARTGRSACTARRSSACAACCAARTHAACSSSRAPTRARSVVGCRHPTCFAARTRLST